MRCFCELDEPCCFVNHLTLCLDALKSISVPSERRSLVVCLSRSLLLTPTLALPEHVRFSLFLPPSPLSLSFLCVYTCTLFLSHTSHTNAQPLSLAAGFCQSFSLIVFRTESASRGARRNNVPLLTNTEWISWLFRALMRLQSHNRHGSWRHGTFCHAS